MSEHDNKPDEHPKKENELSPEDLEGAVGGVASASTDDKHTGKDWVAPLE